jgi:hypothetical protein
MNPVNLRRLCSCALFLSHAGLRVQRASGVPHALSKLRACAIFFLEAMDLAKLGRNASRECEGVFARSSDCKSVWLFEM